MVWIPGVFVNHKLATNHIFCFFVLFCFLGAIKCVGSTSHLQRLRFLTWTLNRLSPAESSPVPFRADHSQSPASSNPELCIFFPPPGRSKLSNMFTVPPLCTPKSCQSISETWKNSRFGAETPAGHAVKCRYYLIASWGCLMVFWKVSALSPIKWFFSSASGRALLF